MKLNIVVKTKNNSDDYDDYDDEGDKYLKIKVISNDDLPYEKMFIIILIRSVFNDK